MSRQCHDSRVLHASEVEGALERNSMARRQAAKTRVVSRLPREQLNYSLEERRTPWRGSNRQADRQTETFDGENSSRNKAKNDSRRDRVKVCLSKSIRRKQRTRKTRHRRTCPN